MASPSRLDRLLFAEPFLAWRAWKVIVLDDGPRLGSVVYDYLWTPREHVDAECMKIPAAGSRPHDAPDEGCACGVYGSTNIEHLRHYVQEHKKDQQQTPHTPRLVTGTRVFGVVALWGTVVECNLGFRAGKAYPKHLYLPCLMHHHADGLEEYGVPVTCVDEENGFEALCAVVRAVRNQETGDGDENAS